MHAALKIDENKTGAHNDFWQFSTSPHTATCKPFVKWVGGKRQILPALIARLPACFNHYFEPFIGGGALMWSIKNAGGNITINDYNADLINL